MNGHHHTGADGASNGATPVPAAALARIDDDIAAAGGPMSERPEDAGSAGRTMFDTPSSEDTTITVLVPRECIRLLPSQALVRIESREDGRTYLGVVVAGPFAEPDGLRGDAAVVVTASVNGGMFLPRYHGRVGVELLGEQVGEALLPPRFRPLPNSVVFPLSSAETKRVLRTGGNVRVGLAVGHEDVDVAFDSARKDGLPRHTAILGTTGGGKSTTVAGMISRLQAAGVAVILLDTEGEYTHLNQPSDDARMLAALEQVGQSARGVPDTHIFHLINRDTANPNHPDVRPFRLRFNDFASETVMEILELNDAQRGRYTLAHDLARWMLRDLGIFPRRNNTEDEERLLAHDDLETGYPSMALAHLLDCATALLRAVQEKKTPTGKRGTSDGLGFDVGDSGAGPTWRPESALFRAPDHFAKLTQQARIMRGDTTGHDSSWLALISRLKRLYRLHIFDNDDARPLPVRDMLHPGRVTIIDLHDSGSPSVNNLTIASLLREVQIRQEDAYTAATARKHNPTPVVVFIEEAHEFLSDTRIKQMPILREQVARIARRGRKRWLGLVFITQLPQHLPDEVFGLVNNFILHKIGDAGVVNRLKQTVPGVDASLWRRLPGLAPGQAIVSITGMTRPLLVAVDPSPARLRMVE